MHKPLKMFQKVQQTINIATEDREHTGSMQLCMHAADQIIPILD